MFFQPVDIVTNKPFQTLICIYVVKITSNILSISQSPPFNMWIYVCMEHSCVVDTYDNYWNHNIIPTASWHLCTRTITLSVDISIFTLFKYSKILVIYTPNNICYFINLYIIWCIKNFVGCTTTNHKYCMLTKIELVFNTFLQRFLTYYYCLARKKCWDVYCQTKQNNVCKDRKVILFVRLGNTVILTCIVWQSMAWTTSV